MHVWNLVLCAVLTGTAAQVHSMSLQDIPKDIPRTDLDLYMATHEIKPGEKVVVPPLNLPDVPGFKPMTMADLPDFRLDVEKKITKTGRVSESGLLSTINYAEFPGRKVAEDRELKLKLAPTLTGFKEEVEVRTFWQAGKAPLAVTLLGFTQLANDINARAYQADLFNAGNHVLSFDSMLRSNMNRATGHGVVGNVVLEGQLCAQIIDSVMRMKDPVTGAPFRDRISSVRLVGFSYGGNLMLQALRDPRVGTWPVDRALVVSTPVDFLRTSKLFDLYNLADGTHFSKMSLAKMLKGYTPKGEVLTAREESLMRAGLGYAFHGDISLIFADNLKRYMPELMSQLVAFSEQPDVVANRRTEQAKQKARADQALADLEARKSGMAGKEYEELKRDIEEELTARTQFLSTRLGDVARWTFKHGQFLMVRPYWDIKADHSDFGRLKELLKGAPNFVQVVIAEDDPLNLTEDLEALKAAVKEPQLLMIPHGGHLGMTGTKWFQAMMAKFFAAK